MLNEFEACEKYIEQYKNLSIGAKANCVNQYLNSVIPYDADELKTFKEVEGSIFYMLSDEQYSIDKNGNWLCEGKQIGAVETLNSFIANHVWFGTEIYVHCHNMCECNVVLYADDVSSYDKSNGYANRRVITFNVDRDGISILVDGDKDGE